MNYKKCSSKKFAPASAVAAAVALAATGAHAQFAYQFPASYNGTGSTITDVSGSGNNGHFDGTLSLQSSVPSGGTGQSISTASGGILTTKGGMLNNSILASQGGFTYDVSFNWNGTDSSSFSHTEKLIDYAGTESLQLVTTAGSASLQMVFADNTGAETVAVSTTVLPNTWYHVTLSFNTEGNLVDGNGDISGLADMVVNGGSDILGGATKGNYGDNLNRPIGVGQLGANFGYLVGFKGDIFDPTVTVPEPSTLALSLMGGIGALGMWKARRRKA